MSNLFFYKPELAKSGGTRVSDDYQELYQQALKEMQQPDFVATGTMLTAWGNKAD